VRVCVCVLSLCAQVAVDMGLFVCKNLGPTIRDVSNAAVNNKRLAVDMAFEQRKAKCDAARMVLDVSVLDMRVFCCFSCQCPHDGRMVIHTLPVKTVLMSAAGSPRVA
jgi:hypothetical protein